MNFKYALLALVFAAPVPALTACARASDAAPAPGAAPAVGAAAVKVAAAASLESAALPLVTVHKSEFCGCCGSWAEHMRKAGFQVEVRNQENLNPIKERVGVPFGKGSCHTAEVGGYFVEGHVPADDVKRLLAEKPKAKGLVVPGMPAGSPGMEVPGGQVTPYSVELVQADGSITVFARHGQE